MVQHVFVYILNFWNWLKDNDAPNWFVIAFSLVVWPIALRWWFNRKHQNIPHFEVLPAQGHTEISGQRYDAVNLTFTNRTGRVVYLARARLRDNPSHFPVPPAAVRDLSGGWRELKFAIQQNERLLFIDHERVLQSNESALTNIAVSHPMDANFFSYRPGRLRRIFRRPKYFMIEYAAMVGEKKYSVATVF